MVSASSRTFRAFSTAPSIGTAKCASSVGGVLGAMTATTSPLPTPRWCRAEASRRHLSAVCRQVAPVCAMHHRQPVRMHGGGTGQKRDWGERDVIGWRLRQIEFGHGCFPGRFPFAAMIETWPAFRKTTPPPLEGGGRVEGCHTHKSMP